MANAGIMHLSFKVGGRPFCNTRRSIMSTTPEHADEWPLICLKCQAAHSAMKERAARKTKASEDFTCGGWIDL